jgi:uncharacterized membrane protein
VVRHILDAFWGAVGLAMVAGLALGPVGLFIVGLLLPVLVVVAVLAAPFAIGARALASALRRRRPNHLSR